MEEGCEELALCARKPLARIDVGFEDLCYTARSWRNSDGTYVLKSVSGQFQSGKLTAILGPSGAGKSTLMDILSGFRRNGGVSGRLLSNGQPRVPRIFRRLSCHVPQEDLLQSKMTAEESLLVSARLKMPPALARSDQHRATVVTGVLKTLGLLKCKDTMVEQLSGGQRKRLSIALELVSNPSVFFLDEPTTGLDSVAMRDCVSLLKLLAEQGRTVVATLHQPPASILLGKVDHLYVLVRGQCVYQGCPHGLAPFLAHALHPQPACPISHNPADFVIETTQGPHEANVILLTMEILNGKRTCSMVDANLGDDEGGEGLGDPGPSCSRKTLSVDPVKYDRSDGESEGAETSIDLNIVVQGPSEWNQFLILLGRMILQMRRNKVALYLQLLHYTLTGLIMSLIYGKHLNDAGQMFLNLKFCLGITVFFTYTQIMVPVLVFPSEVALLRREHFNGWYHLKPYYAALTISRLPLQFVLGFMFLALCYFITDQPMELQRFTYYCILGLGTSVAAEGVGLAIGSLFSVLNGAAMGPLCMATLLCFAIHGIDYARQVGLPMKLLIHTSFMRPSFIGLIKALYGSGRGKLQCPSVRRQFCVYKDPATLIRYLDLEENGQFSGSIWSPILLLIFLGVLCRLIAFLALKWRLSVNKPNIRLVYILKKFFSR
ncbi:ATP-binding cassette subfamily G member 4-like [Ischnura elegans]|uniref:ATP-binding cassette subfamily G member 4-like n=1 Tax=Ischnura elegans TaxID=197161 RepID=UPI001ED8AF78|nr:ATP-binding cassette subfamily G member 4-like [Ischnura elegans]